LRGTKKNTLPRKESSGHHGGIMTGSRKRRQESLKIMGKRLIMGDVVALWEKKQEKWATAARKTKIGKDREEEKKQIG